MKSIFSFTLLSTLLVRFVQGAPAAPISRRTLLPSQDPFYHPPAGYESAAPGTVLRSRSILPASFGLIPLIGVTGHQLLYRTNGAIDNSPGVTVTTVLQPLGSVSNVLVSYQFAEDSNNIRICAPSYVLQEGTLQTNIITDAEGLIINILLLQGWTLSIPDYEGANSSFGAGRVAGHGVLDGIKAALSFSALGLSSNSKILGWGYSGGAIATGWAAALQPTYASTLNMVGWVHGGTPANVSGTLSYLDGTLFAGFGFAGVAGLASAYPAINSFIQQYTTAAGKTAIAQIDSQCAGEDILDFAFQKIESTTYQVFGDQLLYQNVIEQVTALNVLGAFSSETPSAPIFVYHALYDEIIPVADADWMVEQYCANGIKSLQYVRDIGLAEHASAEILFLPAAVQFLRDRVAGVTPQSGCSISNTTTVAVAVDALGSAEADLLSLLVDILNDSIGVDDSLWKAQLKASVTSRQ